MSATAMVARQYRLLGAASAAHIAAAGGTRTEDVPVLFDAGGGAAGIDGLLSADSPSITLPTAAVPDRVVRKDDRFEFNSQAWLAREAGQPLRDGEELRVQLKKA
jgi:hypothetical protein